jgi:hypothetical protein
MDESGKLVTELYAFNIQEEIQVFMIDESGELMSELQKINVEQKLLDKVVMSEEDFGTFTEKEYFIIRIKNELLRYENPKLEYICLTGSKGEYIHEIYVE